MIARLYILLTLTTLCAGPALAGKQPVGPNDFTWRQPLADA